MPRVPVLNVVGAGRVGTTLTRLLADAGLVRPGSLYNRDPEHSRRAARYIGAGNCARNLNDMSGADLWLIAVPDDVIAQVARQLAATRYDWQGRIAFHCSGIHSASVLSDLGELGAATASLHPVQSFANPEKSRQHFTGTCCTVEGDSRASRRLTALFTGIGGRLIGIDADGKNLYHAATAVASNYLVTLFDMSRQLLAAADMSTDDANALLAPLVSGTLDNLLASNPEQALTGPISRGDALTVRRHLEALAGGCPDFLPLYLALARATLSLARRSHPENRDGHRHIESVLAEFG
jgi:predicted short-subunit dehydrogenase-like oxidoreductase (DUF2520 family)